MYLLAPIALLLLASAAFYKTNEVWNKAEYDLGVAFLAGTDKAKDAAQLRLAVERGLIKEQHVDVIMGGKWSEGQQIRPQWQAQQAVYEAMARTHAEKVAAGSQAVQRY